MSRSNSASKTKRPRRRRTDLFLVKSWHSATLLQRIEDAIAKKGFSDRSHFFNWLAERFCDDVGV